MDPVTAVIVCGGGALYSDEHRSRVHLTTLAELVEVMRYFEGLGWTRVTFPRPREEGPPVILQGMCPYDDECR